MAKPWGIKIYENKLFHLDSFSFLHFLWGAFFMSLFMDYNQVLFLLVAFEVIEQFIIFASNEKLITFEKPIDVIYDIVWGMIGALVFTVI